MPNGELRCGAHLPYMYFERAPVVCDTWPMRCQTYGHFSSLRASLPFDWYQVILLGARGKQV